MKKIIIQLIIAIASFFVLLLALQQVNWMKIFQIEKVSKAAENKLGDLVWGIYKNTGKEINKESIVQPIDSLLTKICKSNHIDRTTIKMHILENSEINAFALPDNHLVIFTGLISFCKNEGELSGVIAHELAHLQKAHVMKKLIKEIGLSAIISIATNNKGTEMAKSIAKLLSSSAYDRNLEKEADLTAVEYMMNSKLKPVDFANFLMHISEKESGVSEHLKWVSTHPISKIRAEYIIESCKGKHIEYLPIISQYGWEKLQYEVEFTKL